MCTRSLVVMLFLLITSQTVNAFSIVLDYAGIWRTGPYIGQVFTGWSIYETGVPEDQWVVQLGPAFFTTGITQDFSTARIVADKNALTIDGGQEVLWQVVLGFDEGTTLAGFPPSYDLTFGSSTYTDIFGTSTSDFAPQFTYNTSIDIERRALYEEWLANPPPLQHTPEPSSYILIGLGVLLLAWRYHRKNT